MNPADHALATRDPALRMLARVLDPDEAAGIVAEAMPWLEVRGATAEYVRYKPATSCLVGYRFDTASGCRAGYLKTVAADSEAKIAKMEQRGAVKVGPGLAICLLPYDPRIRALARFGADMTGLLERLGQPPTTPAQVTALAYKPERRYVGLVRSSSRPAAVVRAYTSSGFPEARHSIETHPQPGEVVTPTVLGKSDRYRSVLISWLDGTPLVGDLHSQPERLGSQVGAALAVLHHSNGDDGAPIRGRIASRIATSWKAVGWLLGAANHPTDFSEKLARVVNESHRIGQIHGDFSADQVLVNRDDGRIGVIDWDRSGLADPTWDLASFLADLETRSLAGSLTDSTVAAWRRGFLEGYGYHDDSSRLQPATAAALVARATEPFRHRHPDWARVTSAIVDRARHLTAG